MDSLTPPSGYCDVNYNALDDQDITGAFNPWMSIAYNTYSALSIAFNKKCVAGSFLGLSNGCAVE